MPKWFAVGVRPPGQDDIDWFEVIKKIVNDDIAIRRWQEREKAQPVEASSAQVECNVN